MIEKDDCLMLLAEINKNGIDTKQMVLRTLRNQDIDPEVIKFINNNRGFELSQFYEKLRKSYNNKKSVLYKNIMAELTDQNVDEIVTTISSLGLQIFLFSKNVQDKEMFFKHARLSEVYACLLDYSTTSSLANCVNLLQLVKADIKVLESITRN